jgi:methyl-accepting chemotaxis protein
MTPEQIRSIARKMFMMYQNYATTATPPLVYITMLIMDYHGDRAINTAIALLPPLILVCGLGWPYTAIHLSLKWALLVRPDDRPGARLERILKVPRLIEFAILPCSMLGVGAYVALPAMYYGTSLWMAPWAMLNVLMLSLLLMLQIRLSIERMLRPFALEEFHKNPDAMPSVSGLLWPRQRWYLPYSFGVFVSCTLVLSSTIIGKQAFVAYSKLRGQLQLASPEQFLTFLDQTVGALIVETGLPMLLLGTYLLVNAALSAWRLAQQQYEGSRSVQEAMQALASGSPKLPEWVSTDEVGDLSVATAQAFEQLKAFSISLGESAQNLRRSAEQLGTSTSRQTEVLTLQATALQETQVTAQEIKETSALASQKAENVLKQSEKAEEISRTGEAAIAQSLNGLQEIGEQVREMAQRIKALDERTRQIANITTTVKDLADQSNMLALNAAIEAVRSGEHGKGFGVVAREIRMLADQSIKATNGVRAILQDISTAIRTTVAITEKGSARIESSLVQVRESGNHIQQLANIVRDNGASVRQITAAVTQQNSGIAQIFTAVNELSKMMDQTMVQLRASDEALVLVHGVADKVTGFVGNYGWQGGDEAKGESSSPAARAPGV